MPRTKEIVLSEIVDAKIEIDQMLKEYAKYCYDFYYRNEYGDFGEVDSNLTEDMIMNDEQLTQEDKEQALYFLSLPQSWEKIHEKYCVALKQLNVKVAALDEELHLIDYYEKMENVLNSSK